MRAQTHIVRLSEHVPTDRKRANERFVVCTHVNKGKKYPYGSKRQGYTKA